MANGIDPKVLADLQSQGWIPGAPAAAAPPVPPPAPPATPPAYQPIGAPAPSAFPKGGYAPGNISQADADAALQASLTDGGPVAGQRGAGGTVTPLPGAAAGPATPAGMRPSTASMEEKSGVPETPALAGAQQDLRDASAFANRAQLEQSTVAPLEARARAQEEAIYDGHVAAMEAQRQADYQQGLSNERWKRDKAQAAYDLAVSQGVDPGRYLKNKSIPGLMATAASIIAGGFATWGRGGANPGVEMMNQAIDQDVAAQRDNIGNKKAQADAADTHLEMFMKEGMNKDQAAAATAVLLRQQFGKELDAKYHATSDAMGKLALGQAIQKNAADMAKSEQEYAKLTNAEVTRKVDEKWQAASGGPGADRAKVIKRAQELVDKGKFSNIDDARRFAMGEYGLTNASDLTAAGKAGADKVSPRLGVRLSAVDSASKTIDQVEKIEKGGWGPVGAPQAQGAGAVAQARSAMLEAGIDPGAVNTVFPEGYNPADAHISGKYNERLKQARAMIEHQKTVIQGAVDMSKGSGGSAGDTDEGGP